MVIANDIGTFTATRRSLQAVAEHVLAAALYAASGRIGLRQTPGGFGTPPFASPNGQRRVLVVGADLVVIDERGERKAPLTTLRHAADFAGVQAGAPADVYTPAVPLALDTPLVLDDGSARRLADWYELVNRALELLRAERGDEEPAIVQLWPEHFDLATTISGVNYGGSPGDDEHPLPYLYVGPHTPPQPDGEFWNETFGASRASHDVSNADDAVAFFHDGRRRLA